jgi:hypothetical protein
LSLAINGNNTPRKNIVGGKENDMELLALAGIMVQESWNTGMRRVNRIVEQENAQGNKAWATGMYSELPDILVFNEDLCIALGGNFDAVVRVYESTNYARPDEYIASERAVRYRDTLLKFKCKKIFVCSYEENLRYLDGGRQFFEQHGIEVRVMGNQD